MEAEICSDNREAIIQAAKDDLLRSTNIETRPDEMKVLDSILFRCWQMGWLDKYDETKENNRRRVLGEVKYAIDNKILTAPGNYPSDEDIGKVRAIYSMVLNALRK